MIYGNQAFSISGDVGSDRFGAIFLPWTVLVQIPEIASNLFVLFSSLLPGRERAQCQCLGFMFCGLDEELWSNWETCNHPLGFEFASTKFLHSMRNHRHFYYKIAQF